MTDNKLMTENVLTIRDYSIQGNISRVILTSLQHENQEYTRAATAAPPKSVQHVQEKCETHGHIFGRGDACIFCNANRAATAQKPVIEDAALKSACGSFFDSWFAGSDNIPDDRKEFAGLLFKFVKLWQIPTARPGREVVEALKFYADIDNQKHDYTTSGCGITFDHGSPYLNDRGKKARKALVLLEGGE